MNKNTQVILIVEDDIYAQKTFRQMLKDYTLYFAESEKEMKERLKDIDELGLIIMDIGLRGSKHGLELIEELKQDPVYKDTPIIAITSYVYRFQEKDTKNVGADGYLTKPVDRKELSELLSKFLNK